MNVHLDDKTNLLNFEQPENSREKKKNLGEHLNKAINGMIPQLMHPEVMVQTQKVKIIKLINQRRLVQSNKIMIKHLTVTKVHLKCHHLYRNKRNFK